MSKYNDTYEAEITCPYCHFQFCDSWEWGGEGEHEEIEECPVCEKSFHAERQITVDYKCTPNCVLNAEEHQLEFDDRTKAFFCSVCGKCVLADACGNPKVSP